MLGLQERKDQTPPLWTAPDLARLLLRCICPAMPHCIRIGTEVAKGDSS